MIIRHPSRENGINPSITLVMQRPKLPIRLANWSSCDPAGETWRLYLTTIGVSASTFTRGKRKTTKKDETSCYMPSVSGCFNQS